MLDTIAQEANEENPLNPSERSQKRKVSLLETTETTLSRETIQVVEDMCRMILDWIVYPHLFRVEIQEVDFTTPRKIQEDDQMNMIEMINITHGIMKEMIGIMREEMTEGEEVDSTAEEILIEVQIEVIEEILGEITIGEMIDLSMDEKTTKIANQIAEMMMTNPTRSQNTMIVAINFVLQRVNLYIFFFNEFRFHWSN
jgi:hypothetical protein